MRKSANKLLLKQVAVLLLGSASACGVFAQDAGNEKAIEEITVTSQRREQNLQEVPVAVSAIDGDTIERANLSNLVDVLSLNPSVTLDQGLNSTQSNIKIRGVGTLVNVSGLESSATFIVDGTVLPFVSLAFADIADVDRVEVLRGPQGTLFGKNSTAGAIHVITKRPNMDEFEAYAKFTAAENNEFKVRGMATGPINDQWSYRLNAGYKTMDDYIKSVALEDNNDFNGEDAFAGRFQLQWQPSDAFNAVVIVEGETKDSRCCGQSLSSAGVAPEIAKGFPEPGLSQLGVEDRASNNSQFYNSETWAINFQSDWEILEGYSVKFNVSHRDYTVDSKRDFDRSPVPLSDSVNEQNFDATQVELRLESPVAGFMDYVAGLFYYNTEKSRFIDIYLQCQREHGLFNDDGTFAGCDLEHPRGVTATAGDIDDTLKVENYAVFGDVRLHPTAQLTLFAGGRYLKEELEFKYDRTGNPFTLPTADLHDKTDDSEFIGRAGISYQLTDDVMVYGSYSRGYKGAGYRNNAGTRRIVLVNPETSENFEAGLRSQLLDNRLLFNLTYFDTDFKDFQARTRDPVTDQNEFVNAGEINTKGLELEFIAAMAEGFTLSGGVAYQDTEVVSDVIFNCYGGQTAETGCNAGAGGNRQNLRGTELPNAAEVSLNINGLYEFNTGDWSSFVEARYRWQDGVPYSLFGGDRLSAIDSYGILNLNVGTRSPGGRYEVSFFVNNVTDEFYTTQIDTRRGAAFRTVPRDFERYVGASLQLNWN